VTRGSARTTDSTAKRALLVALLASSGIDERSDGDDVLAARSRVYAHARRLRHKPGNIAEDAIVFMAMDPVPNIDDRIAHAYQRAFVKSWSDFVKGWRSFVDDRRHWYDHMWNGSYDAAIDYRRQANPWRPKFVRARRRAVDAGGCVAGSWRSAVQ
jgi:hypothetical protein